MANPLQRIRRGGQAPAPSAAPEPAPAEASAPGEDGATGHAEATPAPEPPTAAAEPQPAPTAELTAPPAGTAEPAETAEPAALTPAWRVRGRARRRLRHLRAARELALRDLGGLVFDLHRFGRVRPDLVAAKLDALAALDRERRALQDALDDPVGLDILRRPGVASCPRCGTLVASDARFCSGCGVSLKTADVATSDAEPEHVPGAAAATSDVPGT
ncbi:MAG TPA: zinc ribbon domain-containing protein [Solirubrobacteraceae bacterium]|jgi:hypothetical protein